MTSYQYDEKGYFFPFFSLPLLLLFLIPYTYIVLKKEQSLDIPRWRYRTLPVRWDRLTNRKRIRPQISQIIALLGWISVVLLLITILKTSHDIKIYDPHEVLGISPYASTEKIKKHYKKLTLKFHPDKLRHQSNTSKEKIEEYYVQLTKAYKALTDEEVRKNFLLYGNPDGKQEFSLGIAIPKSFVSSKYSVLVLFGYSLLFGIILPLTVSVWWYGSRRNTKDGIDIQTANQFFKHANEVFSDNHLLNLLLESKEIQQLSKCFGPQFNDRKNTETIVKNYLSRNPIGMEKLAVLEKILIVLPKLLNAFINISHALNLPNQIKLAISFNQRLIQAINLDRQWVDEIPVLGCDNTFTAELRESFPVMNLSSFLEMKENTRQNIMKQLPLQTYMEMKEILSGIPRLTIARTKMEVNDSSTITPLSVVDLQIELGMLALGETSAVMKDDIKSYESTVFSKCDCKIDKFAYAPYYPQNYQLKYYVFLLDDKSDKFLSRPIVVEINDQGIPEHLSIHFQAPPNCGLNRLKLWLLCDGYIGLDSQHLLEFNVEQSQDDVSLNASQRLSANDSTYSDSVSEMSDDQNDENEINQAAVSDEVEYDTDTDSASSDEK